MAKDALIHVVTRYLSWTSFALTFARRHDHDLKYAEEVEGDKEKGSRLAADSCC